MPILHFIVQLMSGAMLLLFSVRFMRIGIERLWNTQIRSSLNENSSILGNLIKGAGLGFIMQGATVVMLMAAGMASTGSIPLVSAVVVALGADLGSAIAVQFLQLPISAIGPIAILAGAMLYLRSRKSQPRNLGRVILGLGLVFLSLSLIRTAVAPLGGIEKISLVVDYLNSDLITAALAGIVLTFAMHSSVAAILTAVAFTSHTLLGPAAGVAFMLGCNLGSSLLPIWLLKYENERSKVVVFTVAIARSVSAILVVLVIVATKGYVEANAPWETGAMILGGHIVFNALLMLLAPFCVRLTRGLARRWINNSEQTDTQISIDMGDDPALALPILKRQLSSMLEITSMMFENVMSVSPDKDQVYDLELNLNAALAHMRQAYTQLPEPVENSLEAIEEIVEFAIRVERCGDILSAKIIEIELMKLNGDFAFSTEGEAEIARLVKAVRKAIFLAQETAWSGDVSSAQRLVQHKQEVTELENTSRSKHLSRLRRGNLVSLSSSDQHLEVIAALKEINSKLATIGYAVLGRHGGLKKTRLKSTLRVPAS